MEFLACLSSIPHLRVFFFSLSLSALRIGMRGIMCRVSAYLPALMRMCLFDWKAVRSCYAIGASSWDDQSSAGGWSVCLCVLGVRVSCHFKPYKRTHRMVECAEREGGDDGENYSTLYLCLSSSWCVCS